MTETETEGYRPFELHPLDLCADCLTMLTANAETEGIDVAYWHPEIDLDEARRRGFVFTPKEEQEAETAYVAAVDHLWPADRWSLSPGCPGCEWCRVCPRCGTEEHEHGETDPRWHDPEDGPYCPGPEGGWEEGETERADYCPRDEGSFSWSPCDRCGRSLGGTRHPGAAVYIGHQGKA